MEDGKLNHIANIDSSGDKAGQIQAAMAKAHWQVGCPLYKLRLRPPCQRI